MTAQEKLKEYVERERAQSGLISIRLFGDDVHTLSEEEKAQAILSMLAAPSVDVTDTIE